MPTNIEPPLVLLLALFIDAALGDPPWLYRLIDHPVVLIGRLIGWGENTLNDATTSARRRHIFGFLLTIGVILLSTSAGWLIVVALSHIQGGWIIEAVFVSTLLAFRGLYDHVQRVAHGLERSLREARAAVAHIVGRKPDSLDEAAVARAAIESTAENFSDGVVAPAFWFVLLGLPGLCAYKAVNTLDSMIGHRTARYDAFGTVAARLDDVVNWLPARLAGILLILAAGIMPGANAARAWQTMLRDAPKHRSVNAGWQEAPFAGALGLALAGPRHYGDEVIADHWMGSGRAEATANDVLDGLRLYLIANALLAGCLLGVWLF